MHSGHAPKYRVLESFKDNAAQELPNNPITQLSPSMTPRLGNVAKWYLFIHKQFARYLPHVPRSLCGTLKTLLQKMAIANSPLARGRTNKITSMKVVRCIPFIRSFLITRLIIYWHQLLVLRKVILYLMC